MVRMEAAGKCNRPAFDDVIPSGRDTMDLRRSQLQGSLRVCGEIFPGHSLQCRCLNFRGRSHTVPCRSFLHIAPTSTAKSLQSCPTLCDPTDGSPPGSPVPGILQARTLEWVAISFSSA